MRDQEKGRKHTVTGIPTRKEAATDIYNLDNNLCTESNLIPTKYMR